MAYHRDSSGWSERSLPASTSYNDVHVSASDDAWVVGDNGFVAHFDGLGWTEHEAITDKALNAVWAVSPELVFAMGGDWQANTAVPQGVILYYDGTGWYFLDDETLTVFDDIWADSAGSVWAVGDVPDEEDPDGRIWHFDGTQWMQDDKIWNSPNAIWGTGPQDIYVVGFGGDSTEILQRYGCR